MSDISFNTFLINLKGLMAYTKMVQFDREIFIVSDMKESYIRLQNINMDELNGKCISNIKSFLNRLSFVADEDISIKEIDDNKIVLETETTEIVYSFSDEVNITNNFITKTSPNGIVKIPASKIFNSLNSELNKLPKVSVELTEEKMTSILKMVRMYQMKYFYFVIDNQKLYAKVEDTNKNYTKIFICDVDSVKSGTYKIQTLPHIADWNLSLYTSPSGKEFVKWSIEGEIDILTMLPDKR